MRPVEDSEKKPKCSNLTQRKQSHAKMEINLFGQEPQTPGPRQHDISN